ncbi:MAG: DUF4038 domain-containing protein [Rhodobacteraceae bacterium]|jgi:hypothetical protein|nr:DUF4038 domain-containing protein [Paracoccaceae bacterium]
MTHLYDIHEVRLTGPATGNPYREVELYATFALGNREVRVTGFHDGGTDYVVRFMPDRPGDWRWTTQANVPALDGQSGAFTALPARPGVHGPVRVRDRFHFAHDDGTPYLPFGTTCYAWTHQPLAMQDETLATLARTRFNKIRMGVFPKDYPFNENDPLQDIFLRGPDGQIDFDRPNPAAFRHFETQVARLADLGIEADVIMFHPYDRWGYASMTAAQNRAYVRYLAARLSAHRNVWWALANEYDFLLDTIPMAEWDGFCHLLEEHDHVGHLRSIHNGDHKMNFDHRKPWISHVCIQNWDVKRTQEWRAAYGKPVVNDEPEYEGSIWASWGNITAQELTHRFWTTLVRGGYAGHGETYADPDDLIWWAKGGKLHGQAWQRIGFLRDLLEQSGVRGLEPLGSNDAWPWSRVSGARDLSGRVTFIYLGEHQPDQWTTGLPKTDVPCDVDIIDTWAMTITPAERIPAYVPHPTRHGEVVRGGVADAAFGVRLPARPYLAIRVTLKG